MSREAPQPTSSAELWGLTALGLAIAFVFALIQPSVSRPPPGFPTFIALCLTILACAFEVAAITQRLLARGPGWLRAAASVISLVGVLAGGSWLLGRPPGRDVLFVWIVVPPAVGIGAVASAGRRGSWAAVAFLAAAGILVAALGSRYIGL
jgi:hypothetical protein